MNYVKRLCIMIVLLFFLFSCEQNSKKDNKNIESEKVRLKDLLPLNDVDSIEMINNYGIHMVRKEKLKPFINKLGEATLEKVSLKMGAIHFSIFIKGKRIPFSGRTHGDYIESYSDFFPKNKMLKGDLYFRVNDLNLDNY